MKPRLDNPIGSPKLQELAKGKKNVVIISSDPTKDEVKGSIDLLNISRLEELRECMYAKEMSDMTPEHPLLAADPFQSALPCWMHSDSAMAAHLYICQQGREKDTAFDRR